MTEYTKEDKQQGYLLQEDTFKLLLEDGGDIIIGGVYTDYTKETKP